MSFAYWRLLVGGAKKAGSVGARTGQKLNVNNEDNCMKADIEFIPVGHAKARAERWLAENIKRAKKEIFAVHDKLTPEIARLLLDRNPENRSIKAHICEIYHRDISAGRWADNGEPIIVSKEGWLNDGQHRCSAVINAGRAIPCLFVFGPSYETRLTVDEGTARTPGDYLAMEGSKYANHIAALASALLQVERSGRMMGTAAGRPTKQEIRERAATDPRLLVTLEAVGPMPRTRVATLTILSTAHYLFALKSREKAEEFIRQVVTGVGLSSRDPAYVVREKLMKRNLRLNTNEKLKALIRAWNAWRKGNTVRSFEHGLARGEKLPEVQ